MSGGTPDVPGISGAAPPVPMSQAGRRRVLAVLCITVTVSYGILFYAFPVLLTDLSADTGWSRVAITAAFSGSLLVAAVAGIPFGRHLDRHGPRWIMTAGSILAGPAVVIIALAPNLAFFAGGWLIAGISMAALFYPPAFTAVTRWYGAQRVKALTLLTLAAGLASTVFAPVTAFLLDHIGWQNTYLTLAAVLTGVTAPAHWWGLRGPWPRADRPSVLGGTARSADEAGRITRKLPFVATTIALSLGSFTAFAVVINLVPLLVEQGMATSEAALALGLGGLGQVAGRIAYPAMTRRLGVRGRTTAILLATATTTAVLGVLTVAVALMAASVVAGMARGLLTLLQATAVSDRWGVSDYGRLTGVLSAPITVTIALAPWAGAAMAELTGSYSSAFLLLTVVGLTSVGFGLISVPRRTHA